MRNRRKDFVSSIVTTAYFMYVLFLVKQIAMGTPQPIVLMYLAPAFLLGFFPFLYKKGYLAKFMAVCFPLLFFFGVYYFFSTQNIHQVPRGVGYILVMAMSIVIAYTLLRKFSIGVASIRNSFLLLSVFVVFIPHFLIARQLEFGAFYNLMDDSLPTSTTVEGPLIVSILFLIATFDFQFNKNRSAINIFSICLSFYTLLLFSRRGFILSSIIALILYWMCIRARARYVIYISLFFLFIPMFWDILSVMLVAVFKSDTVSALIERSDATEIAEATGRTIGWTNSLKAFFSVDPSLLFGFPGGPPESFFVDVMNSDGRYSHAHNTFLQIFLDGGYLSSLLFLGLLIGTLKRINRLKEITTVNNLYLLILLFLFSLSGTESLVRVQQFSVFFLAFVVIGCNIFTDTAMQEVSEEEE